jgi:tight adherence protein B
MNISFVLMIILFITVSLAIFMVSQLWGLALPRLEQLAESVKTNGKNAAGPQLLRDTRLSRWTSIDRLLGRFSTSRRLQLLLSQAGLPWMVDQLAATCTAVGVSVLVTALIVSVPWQLAGIGGGIGLVIPVIYVFKKRKSRRSLFDQQLPDFLDAIAHAMQAGHSFSGAISLISKEAPDPVGNEFRLVFEEINFGRPVQEGLQALSYRLDSDDVQYFVMAVKIHTQTGGNLAALLLNLSALIRDRQRLRKAGQVLSAEGRLSGWILGSLPFLTAALIYTLNPEFLSILWRDPAGILVLKVTAVMMVVGILWMWRLIHFRI